MSSAASMARNEIETRAAAWLVKRRDCGGWNAEDEAALNSWLDECWAHRVAYWRLDAVWESADRLGVLAPHESEAARGRFWPGMMKLAAAFAATAIIGSAAAYWLAKPETKTYATSVGGRELIRFADGTEIELNTDTVLRAQMTTAERTIWLEKGEAYFQVKRDAAHPFVVRIGNDRVTDLGTKFFIRRDGKNLKVALVEGRVRLAAADKERSKTAVLKPGDEALVSAGDFSIVTKTAKELANEFSWRRGVVIFRHTSLADAAAEFNRYNRRKIAIADPQTGTITIDGTFLTNDPGAFTDAAQTVFGLKVHERGDVILVSR